MMNLLARRYARSPLAPLSIAFLLGSISACGSAAAPIPGGTSDDPASSSPTSSSPSASSSSTSSAPASSGDPTSTGSTPVAATPSSLPECTAQRVVYLTAGNGGFAWFTQIWPLPDVVENFQADYALDDPSLFQNTSASADHPLYSRLVDGTPLFGVRDDGMMPTAFVSGKNETHPLGPTQTISPDGNVDVIAANVAAQKSFPTEFAFLQIGGTQNAATAPAPIYASNLTSLLAALTSQGLPAATATALTPDQAILATWYGTTATPPQTIASIANGLLFSVNSFKMNVSSTVTITAMDDDPHGAFDSGTSNVTASANMIASVLAHFYATLQTIPEPACSHNGVAISLAQNTALVVSGDTPKNSFNRSGWPDGTVDNSNWVYIRSNGFLKPGWFGSVTSTQASGFDPQTGLVAAAATSDADKAPTTAAILYAISRGNTKLVASITSATYAGAVP